MGGAGRNVGQRCGGVCVSECTPSPLPPGSLGGGWQPLGLRGTKGLRKGWCQHLLYRGGPKDGLAISQLTGKRNEKDSWKRQPE